jgi:hypothetical protein
MIARRASQAERDRESLGGGPRCSEQQHRTQAHHARTHIPDQVGVERLERRDGFEERLGRDHPPQPGTEEERAAQPDDRPCGPRSARSRGSP